MLMAHTEQLIVKLRTNMRTKALLLAAATAAFGLTSQAQTNLYSVNVVGYVNISLPANKYILLNNPLDAGNNVITNVIKDTLPDSVFLYPYVNGVGFDNAEQYIDGFGWFPGTNILTPGKGSFIVSPVTTNFTLVGSVIQGTSSNALVTGYSLTGSKSPVSFPVGAAGFTSSTNTLTIPAADGDNIYLWNTNSQTYVDAIQYVGGFGWFDPNSVYDTNGPVPKVGEAFFIYKAAGAPWVENFIVQ